MTATPQKFITSDPSKDVLYPGAMIQGRSHRDAMSIGDVLPLTVEKRAPIRVSIPSISNANSENYRVVAPNQAEVGSAVGNIIGNATADELDTPSSISFVMRSYHSESQFGLSVGASGRYLNYEASANASVEQTASLNTVAV